MTREGLQEREGKKIVQCFAPLKDNRLCVGSVYSWTSEDVILGAVPRTCAEAARARGQLGTHLTSVGQKVSN